MWRAIGNAVETANESRPGFVMKHNDDCSHGQVFRIMSGTAAETTHIN